MRSENAVRLRVGTGEEVLSPRWGWVSFVGRNPALTRWAIIWRPSGPGASAIRRFAAWGCARNADTLDVSHRLDSFEEEAGIDLDDVQSDINRLEREGTTARAKTPGHVKGLGF
jgi:hypothetical protein